MGLHTLTIIFSMAEACAWIWCISKNDDDKVRKDIKRHDAEFQEAQKL